MSDFEVLKELVECGLTLKRRGSRDEEAFTHYLLSAGTGNNMKSVLITREDWNTPAAAWAMRLLLDGITKQPVLKEPNHDDARTSEVATDG